METTPPSKRPHCEAVNEETDIDVVNNKRLQHDDVLSRQCSTSSNTEYYQMMLEQFRRALTDHRATDQLIWPYDGDLTDKTNALIARMEENKASIAAIRGRQESLLNPTDAITVTNEEALEAARAEFPEYQPGEILDKILNLCKKTLLAEKGRLAERQAKQAEQQGRILSERVHSILDATPDDFKPLAK